METARLAWSRLAAAGGQDSRRVLLTGLAALGVSVLIGAWLFKLDFRTYDNDIWRWPMVLALLTGAGWGLYWTGARPWWPSRVLYACGGAVLCATAAQTAAFMASVNAEGMTITQPVDAFTTAIVTFVGAILLPVSDGAREEFNFSVAAVLYIAACWGLLAAALWKGWQAMQARNPPRAT